MQLLLEVGATQKNHGAQLFEYIFFHKSVSLSDSMIINKVGKSFQVLDLEVTTPS